MSSPAPGAIPPKPVLLFAAHALVLALLIGNWPSPRALYPPAFRAQAQLLLGRGDPPALQLRAATGSALGEKDTFVEAVGGERGEPLWRLSISALRLGYWPSAVLLALLLATPLSPRRRLLAVGLGLLWIDAFALGRLGLEALRAFAELEAGLAPGSSAPATGSLLLYRTASEVLNSNIVVIAAVLLGWAVVSRPRTRLDTRALVRLLGGSAPAGPRVP